MIWQGFTRAHDPTIEGLRHGGAAEHTRHALTAFGSGWRGLVALSPADIKSFTGMRTVGGIASDSSYAREIATHLSKQSKITTFHRRGQIRRSIDELNKAAEWSDRTGFDLVILNSSKKRDVRRQLIRHERIHSLEGRYPNHPFIKSEIANAPELETSIKSALKDPAKAKGALNFYTSQDQTTQVSEKLAWGRQADQTFFSRAKAGGLELPQLAGAHPPIVDRVPHGSRIPKAGSLKQLMQSGEHVHQTSTARRIFNKLWSSARMPRGL